MMDKRVERLLEGEDRPLKPQPKIFSDAVERLLGVSPIDEDFDKLKALIAGKDIAKAHEMFAESANDNERPELRRALKSGIGSLLSRGDVATAAEAVVSFHLKKPEVEQFKQLVLMILRPLSAREPENALRFARTFYITNEELSTSGIFPRKRD